MSFSSAVSTAPESVVPTPAVRRAAVRINDELYPLSEMPSDAMLLDFLRETCHLTGTKEGCNEGDCGACTVLLGRLQGGRLRLDPINACIKFLHQCEGQQIFTVEGFAAPWTSPAPAAPAAPAAGQDEAEDDTGADDTRVDDTRVDDTRVLAFLHPVQRSMVGLHGSQCGFCTPGFISTLVGWTERDRATTTETLAEYLSGNLCRCTGYGPILAAGRQAEHTILADREALGSAPAAFFSPDPGIRAWEARKKRAFDWLVSASERPVGPHDGPVETLEEPEKQTEDEKTEPASFFARPRTLEELDRTLARQPGHLGHPGHPGARFVAGATDLALDVTKKMRSYRHLIDLSQLRELDFIEHTPSVLTLGGGLRYAALLPVLELFFPQWAAMLRRLGSVPIRSSGTLGGNIANGSPIGDMPPCLLALEAELVLYDRGQWRTMPLSSFFLAYGKQNRHPHALVYAVRVPLVPSPRLFVAKNSKREGQDISSFLVALCVREAPSEVSGEVSDGWDVTVACGGMAGVPKRARHTEALLRERFRGCDSSGLRAWRVWRAWLEAGAEGLLEAWREDFAPLSDLRGSATYRLEASAGTVRRFLLEALDDGLAETNLGAGSSVHSSGAAPVRPRGREARRA